MKRKIVVKVRLNGQESRSKALKTAVSLPGVESAEWKGDEKSELEVIGDGVDAVVLVQLLRKRVGNAEPLFVGAVEKKAEEPKKQKQEEPKKQKQEEPPMNYTNMVWPPYNYYYNHPHNYNYNHPYYNYINHVSEGSYGYNSINDQYAQPQQQPFQSCSIM